MSRDEPPSASAPFLSDDSEAEEQVDAVAAAEQPASGVSSLRALLTVLVLCYINLLNYMDRFTVAGGLSSEPIRGLHSVQWSEVKQEVPEC